MAADTPSTTRRRALVTLVALGALGLACEDPFTTDRSPLIVDVRPAAAEPGAAITLIGERFGLRGDRDRVWLGGIELAVESWTDTAVLVRVPDASRGLADLVVRSGSLVSAPYPFEVLPPVE